MSSITVFAQQKAVSGTVKDETGETLPGVTVKVKNKDTGTITDFDGKYSITVNQGDILEFSYIGLTPQTAVVGTSNTIDITLREDVTVLTETVVIGYGTAKKRDLTGSITTIKGDDVANKPSSNPMSLIQGKVAGVQITNSGRAGDEPDVRIRGTNSINGAKPLYIVDGLFNDNINFLNPADIESMEVLKDPSSLAIFGVRGANGVIIITTKRAKEGKTVVNINSSVGAKQVVNKIKLTNAAEFKELYNEQRVNEGATTPYDYYLWQADTDWQDEIFQNGLVTQNNISISGANEKSKFYMGVGYIYEEGIINHEKMNKISINVNDEYSISKNFRVGFQFNGYKENSTDNKKVTAALQAAPIAAPYNEEYQLYSVLPDFQNAQIGNPMFDIELRANKTLPVKYRAVGNVYGELDFLKHFNFRVAFSADYGFNQQQQYTPITMAYNPYIVDAAPIDTISRTTSVSQYQNIYTKIQQDYLLTYKQQIKDHGITVTAGFTTNYNSYSQISGSRQQGDGLPFPDDERNWYLSWGDKKTQTNDSEQWDRATVSFLTRALYNYKNKYLFNASYRRDGSSAFTNTNNEWQDFGAVGAGWIVTEEDFMRNQNILDYLKIKASWGILGNQATGTSQFDMYPSYPQIDMGSAAIFGGNVVPAYSPKYIASPDLRWETVHAWEAGFETNLLHNKLHFEAVYYNKLTKDMLSTVPGQVGSVPGLANVGEIANKGLELAASWNSTIGKDWTYGISGNLTTIDNEVKKLGDIGYEIISGPSRVTVGYPIGYFYGYKSEGIYQTKAEINQSPVSKLGAVEPGDIKFADTDGDNTITVNDRTMIGNPTPDFTYGGSVSIGYKNVDLIVDVMGVYGNEIYKSWDQQKYTKANYPIDRLNRWNGVGTSNWEPILSQKRDNNYYDSDYYIEDGSFFRVRNIQLGYNLAQSAVKKLRLQSLRLYVNAQNPVTFKNSTGYTPEIGGSSIKFGVDEGTYPIPAVYTFGFNLSF